MNRNLCQAIGMIVRPHESGGSASLITQALGSAHGATSSTQFVAVGDVIDTEGQEGFLRGHGTYLVDGRLVATLCGVVERVNKLIYVRPMHSRYSAEQGDVVVGRVTEIAGKRWKVDLNSRQEAGLLLSAVNLAGGIQRRRNAEDELNMRTVFKECDLVSAEVQSLHADGSIALHTRSNKYGKLVGGQLITVPAATVKRQKQHFHTLETLGVDVILGCNGLLWVAPHRPPAQAEKDTDVVKDATDVTLEQRVAATRVANAVRALARLHLSIYPATILSTVKLAVDNNVALPQMLEVDFLTLVVRSEAVRRVNDVT